MIISPNEDQIPDLITQIKQSKEIDVRSKFNGIMRQYVKSQEINLQLRNEVKCLERKRDISNNEVKQLIVNIELVRHERNSTNEKVKDIKETRNNLHKDIRELKGQIKREKHNKRKLKENINDIKQKASSLHGQVKVLAKESETLHKEMMELINQKQRKIKDANGFHEKLIQTKVDLNTSKINKLKMKRLVNRQRKQLQK